MSFDEIVTFLMEGCPGAVGVAVVDPDGIPIVTSEDQGDALEALGAEFSTILREVEDAGRELTHGDLRQLVVHAQNATVVLTSIADGYFLVVVLDTGGLAGKARFASRLAGKRLYSEFV